MGLEDRQAILAGDVLALLILLSPYKYIFSVPRKALKQARKFNTTQHAELVLCQTQVLTDMLCSISGRRDDGDMDLQRRKLLSA